MTPILSLGLSLCFGVAGPDLAAWADAGLPVCGGLEVWLDATRLGAARAAEKVEDLPHGGLDVWWDASGRGRHAQQAAGAGQPTLTVVGEHPVVRFDGQDDHLRVVGLDGNWAGATIFVVAVPRSNPGGFRGLLAGNQIARRDYMSGFALDQGPLGSPAFDTLNWEGAGFIGAGDLCDAAYPFGGLVVVDATVDPADRTARVAVNGKESGKRPYVPGPLRIDELTVGSRYYTNGTGAQQARGTFEGDLREVLVYSRALTDAERVQVRDYLKAKHEPFRVALEREANAGRDRLQPLKPAADPPPVQVFIPGFDVRELPIDLTNINNLRYRPDGRVFTLAYSGDIYLLDDSDGDGLEDRSARWWEGRGSLRGPIGMALVPPGSPLGDAVVVASKGKLSAISDKDGDGVAETETVLAKGWKEITQAVDTLGVARDRDGNWYFGLGTADYTNGHLVGPDGKSKFDLKSERGTILKLSPDFSKREIVCTGIRFPVGLAINSAGDLFATDQEGATWLPNGNPFDELLHIQPGRHYGFPPRHPRHLPGVIDEPSVFDYGPQHQSTCGLIFNEPVNGGPAFGPANWKDNAIVCGYSRGKLYRTELVKTAAGYVARNELFAGLGMLPADTCVTPKGALLVAAHGGSPDWGSGPEGHGKLFRIEPVEGETPRPVLTWAEGSEVKIAFDRPLDSGTLRDLVARTEIVHGAAVAAGDRFEVHRPGYAVVSRQVIAPRRRLEVASARISPDLRTLSFVTTGHTVAEPHAISFPDVASKAKTAGLPRHPQIDLAYDLCGVRATWTPRGAGAPEWIGWLPHLDLDVARTFTAGSTDHDRLWAAMKRPGTLLLETKLNLGHMLRPVVQPGSTLDAEFPDEVVTLTAKGSGPLSLSGPDGTAEAAPGGEARRTIKPEEGKRVSIQVRLEAPDGNPKLEFTWSTDEDARQRALPLRRMIQPWVPDEDATASLAKAEARVIPELAGGRWSEGRKAFFSGAVACGACHAVNGRGGTIGPDLSNLIHRDFASVWRDVTRPSDAIHPDYIAHAVTLDDGRVLTGTIQSRGDQLLIGDNLGKTTVVERGQVEDVKASTISVMPSDLLKALGEPALKDILTFLLTEPPSMPEYGKGTPPPPRPRAELEAALKGSEEVKPERALRIVLVDGEKDHGPGEHDYPAWRPRWAELLGGAEKVTVATAREWPSPEQWADADVVVFFQRGAWNAGRAKDLDAFLARGGGAVYLHWAVTAQDDHQGLAKRIGLASLSNGKTKYRHGPLELDFSPAAGHPIARGFGKKVAFVDESYWDLIGDPKDITPLATGVEEGQPRPLFWVREVGKGRVFVSILGHYSWTFDDPLFRLLTLRGILWSAREPVDRFNDLVLPGARLQQ